MNESITSLEKFFFVSCFGYPILVENPFPEFLLFAMLGIDSDNSSEFINHHLWNYCEREGIQFIRYRAYKKDDNAHVEQKNWTHVRKFLGWDR